MFTAHPTEASRRSILDKLAEIARLVEERGMARCTDWERRRIDRRVDELIDAMWQTDEIRREKPQPLDEARTLLYYLEQIVRNSVPHVWEDLDIALDEVGQRLDACVAPIVFGSWVGGDRDGNPNVTATTTREVIELQRTRALRILIDEVENLRAELSTTELIRPASDELIQAVERDARSFPDVHRRIARINDGEWYRLRLGVMVQRLQEADLESGRRATLRPTGRACRRSRDARSVAASPRRRSPRQRSTGPGAAARCRHRFPSGDSRHPRARHPSPSIAGAALRIDRDPVPRRTHRSDRPADRRVELTPSPIASGDPTTGRRLRSRSSASCAN